MASIGLLSMLAFAALEGCSRARDSNGQRAGAGGGEGGECGSPEDSTTAGGSGAATSDGSPCPTFDPDAAGVHGLELLHPSDRYEIYVLGVVADLVYFVEGEALRRIPMHGGEPETLGPLTGSWVRLTRAEELVWARANGAAGAQELVRAPLDDPEDLNVVVATTPSVQHVVLDESHVFWSTTGPHDVFRAALDGGDAELLVVGGQPLGAIVHAGYYYWIDAVSDQLERVPVGGGVREELARVLFGGPMGASDGAIFWGDTVLSTIEKWTPDSGRVQLASAIDPLQLQVWGTTLYWSQGLLSGQVRSIAVDGGEARDVLCRLRPRTSFHVTDAHLVVGGGSGLLRWSR